MHKSGAVGKEVVPGLLRKGKMKKQMRQEAMRKEKEHLLHLRDTACKDDLLDEYEAFRRYERNGVIASLESTHGSGLSDDDIDACIALQRVNLVKLGTVQGWDEAAARDALRHDESRVILVRGALEPVTSSAQDDDEWVLLSDTGGEEQPGPSPTMVPSVIGYVHLQFCISEPQKGGQPMLCVLNMQLDPAVMGLGLGKFVLQLVELIARKSAMELVMLCVKDGVVTTMRLTKQKPSEAASKEVADVTGTDADIEGFEVVSRPPAAALQARMAPAIKC